MKSIYFPQTKPTTAMIIGYVFLIFSFFSFDQINQFITLFLLGILIVGYNISYEITSDFNNKKAYTFFGLPIIKFKFNLEFPDYISLFESSYSKSNTWGPVSALGTSSKADMMSIRLFSATQKTTIYKSGNYKKVEKKAKELSEMLGVELYNANN